MCAGARNRQPVGPALLEVGDRVSVPERHSDVVKALEEPPAGVVGKRERRGKPLGRDRDRPLGDVDDHVRRWIAGKHRREPGNHFLCGLRGDEARAT